MEEGRVVQRKRPHLKRRASTGNIQEEEQAPFSSSSLRTSSKVEFRKARPLESEAERTPTGTLQQVGKKLMRRNSLEFGQPRSSVAGERTLSAYRRSSSSSNISDAGCMINKSEQERAAGKLQDAVEANDPGQMLSAIHQARANGLDKSSVDQAVRLLQCLEMKAALARAAAGQDAEELRQSLQRAKRAGVGAADIKSAKHALEVLEASEALQMAVGSREIGFLRMNINIAQDLGADKQLVKQAQTVFADCTLQHHMAKVLQGSRPNIAAFEGALAIAVERNVDGEAVQQAMDLLAELKGGGGTRGASTKDLRSRRASSIRSSSIRSSSVAGKAEDSTLPEDPVELVLSQAILAKESGMLRMALHRTEDCDFKYRSLRREAEQLLHTLETDALLAAALRRPEPKKLKEALEKAQEHRIESPHVEQAEHLLQQMSARERLSRAITSKNEVELRSAIDEAGRVEVDQTKIEKAEQVLTQVHARQQLTVAIQARDVDELTSALQVAKIARLDRRHTEKAENLLRSLQPRRKSVPATC